VSVGAGSFVNYGCRFNTSSPVVIGERCNIGMDVAFVTDTHEPGTHGRRAGANTSAPIFVGDGVWIGARATVLPGVTIHDGAIIAAGAVVTKDCVADGLYGGVPATQIRQLSS
jgi:acetyltransferase-like isoleucine patch superfamily enzyme